jgi:hypothetical protein
MWPFKHRHDWRLLAVKGGPMRLIRDGEYHAHIAWLYDCRCGEFMASCGGVEHLKVSGHLPKDCRDPIAFMLQFLPPDRVEPEN